MDPPTTTKNSTMNKTFIDTSAFIALTDSSDKNHVAASNYLKKLISKHIPLLTSNFVVDESITRIKRALGIEPAIIFRNSLKSSSQLEIIYIDDKIEDLAWEIMQKYKDQKFSYTDCTSFALMRMRKTGIAFTFDKHFKIAGFEIVP